NRDNLYEIYGDRAFYLLKILFAIADGDTEKGEVNAVIYYSDWYDDAVKNWNNLDPNLYDGTPNDVADQLDDFIEDRMENLVTTNWTGQERIPPYLLIVGGDEILPFYRMSSYSETRYASDIDLTVISEGYFFSDSAYADISGDDYMKGEPEVSHGRIVGASVIDMESLILKGLVGPQGNNVVIASGNGRDGTANYFIDGIFTAFKEADIKINGREADSVTVENDSMIKSSEWNCQDFIDALNRKGTQYVVHGNHSTNLSFMSGTSSCSTDYLDSAFRGKNLYETYLVAMGGCHAGALYDKENPSRRSSLAYQFIQSGACAYFGSGGLTIGNEICFNGCLSEEMFNSFFENMTHDGYGSVSGEAYKKALRGYVPMGGYEMKYIEGQWDQQWIEWSSEDTNAVMLFNLFGIPWMNLNFPSEEQAGLKRFSDIKKGCCVRESGLKKREDQEIAGADLRSGGTFSKSFTFVTTDYNVMQEDSFDIVEIPGADLGTPRFGPVLPYFTATIDLPESASVVSLELTGGSTQSLGRLNIPSYDPDSGGFTEITGLTGLIPRPNYRYDVRSDHSHLMARIFFYPIQYDADTGESVLWTEATVEVQYQVEECIFISAFLTDRDYVTTEPVTVTATVRNVGDRDVSGLTAVFAVTDSSENFLRSVEQDIGIISAGGSREVTMSVENGLDRGWYTAGMGIRDGSGSVISGAWELIGIISDHITGMTIPGIETSFDIGSEMSFEVTYENHNPYPLEGLMTIRIYDSRGTSREIFADIAEIPASSSEKISISGNTRGLEPGRYEARALFVQQGKADRISDRISFIIRQKGDLNCDFATGLADALIALRLAASEDAPLRFCLSDADGDGRIGLADAVFILQKIVVPE
ncbi:MAG: hypothetical protein DRI57_31990, partial [Deltaproteobacteria bacterium]